MWSGRRSGDPRRREEIKRRKKEKDRTDEGGIKRQMTKKETEDTAKETRM